MRDWLLPSSNQRLRPYEYSGYMSPCIEQALKMRREGAPYYKIAQWMYDVAGLRSPNIEMVEGRLGTSRAMIREYTIRAMRSGIRAVELHSGFGPVVIVDDERAIEKAYRRARMEHAFLLRSENVLFKDIAERLGVGAQRARQLALAFGRRLSFAMKRTKVRIATE